MVLNKDETKYPNSHHKRKDMPSVLARSLFYWMLPVFWIGNQRDLEEYDLKPTQHCYDSKVLGEKLERNWLKAEREARLTGKKPKLLIVLVKTFLWSYWPGGILLFISNAIRTVTPLLFSQMLQYWTVDSTMTREVALYYGVGMILANWVAVYTHHNGLFYCQQFGMKIRVATSSLMFRKILRMSNRALGETTAGKVVNLLSNDMQRFDLALAIFHRSWIIPLQVIGVAYFGYLQAGYAAVLGIASLVLVSLPIQGIFSYVTGKIRFRNADKTDARIKIMNEVINGIQVIKMYAWEIPFQKLVGQKRLEELKEVKKATILRALFSGFMMYTESLALFIAVLVFILSGNNLTATVFYPLQQFIRAVEVSVTFTMPQVLSFTAEMFVSINRIQEFLYLAGGYVTKVFKFTEDRPDFLDVLDDNINSNCNTTNPDKIRPPVENTDKSSDIDSAKETVPARKLSIHRFVRSVSKMGDSAVIIRNVSASWTGDPTMMALKNISAKIQKGKLCAIIGSVGSGKSSILQLLLKELPAAIGTIEINGKISYASQEPWLYPGTIRENILFGMDFDLQKYNEVCKACALEKDFKQFPYGDQTLVGERGVSLSGGQRARINLARSVYRESDIYLLDDPLSAVDTNVGRQLFSGCINGYLLGKTRILVTHQIHFLKAADYIIVLNEGGIENMGTYDELVNTGTDFAMILSALQEGKNKDTDSFGLKGEENRFGKTPKSNDKEGLPGFAEQKMADEKRASGNLRPEVIFAYFRSGGSNLFLLYTMFIFICSIAISGAVDYWTSFWTNKMAKYEESLKGAEDHTGINTQVGPFTVAQYLMIYGGLVFGTVFLSNYFVIPFSHLCVSASCTLHNNMFSSMLKGIMRFFDTSSSGRILNRFTKDMGALDDIMPRTLKDLLQIHGTLFIILVLNAIALYWTLIPSFILLILFFFMVRIYLKAAQGIKRLEGTTKSPVFGMVTSSLNGISTIRSCNAQNRLIQQFDTHQDLHNSAWNSFLAGSVTIGFWLDTLCLIYLACVIFVFLFIDIGDIIPVGSVGLAITQTSSLTLKLQYGARMLVEFLAQLTCVERILEYSNIESEAHLVDGPVAIPPNWPSKGNIMFQNVSLRYSPTEKPVLKNLNIKIESGWKVGIVGRTGAGKSSLISALFRFAYIDGLISIDELDTSQISRQGLRSKISIIPQEPVLFSATIRYNLDPFDLYSDDDLWRALEQVDLKSAIPSLDFKVTEGGANFSVGQRQLMCLARAVLRSNQILIMDEATANVDPQTDSFIQETIRRQFVSCTVLTIAHRLNTIIDSDRVLVMSSGEIAEFDHPYVLLSDPNSHFSSMVRETGDKNSSVLFQVAKDAYFRSNAKENVISEQE